MKDSIFAKVCECITRVKSPKNTFQPSQFLKADLGLESIDMVDFLYELEQEFGTEFYLTELNRFILENCKNTSWDLTVEQACLFVEQKER